MNALYKLGEHGTEGGGKRFDDMPSAAAFSITQYFPQILLYKESIVVQRPESRPLRSVGQLNSCAFSSNRPTIAEVLSRCGW